MTTVTATKARENLFQILKKSVKGHTPVRITAKTGDAVLVSEADYEGLLETLELLSVRGLYKGVRRAKLDIKAGRTKALKDVFGR
jgi:antitoxin YefM